MAIVRSAYALRKNDLYETEAWATRALLRHLDVKGLSIIEPAAGNHKIADVLKLAGANVFTSDIAVYDREHDHVGDFFDETKTINENDPSIESIVTNPPYGHRNSTAQKFARHALEIVDGYVALLMTMKFDSGKKRTDLFRDNDRFIGKIVLLDRISLIGNGESGTEDHAWYVWGPKL